jgi:hypothetical protein
MSAAGSSTATKIAVDGSEIILYAYGPDADALYAAMELVIARSALADGSYPIKRYGEASDPGAKQVRLDIA